MSYTESDREIIRRAIVRGERRVTFGDKTVEYRSVDELRSILRKIDMEIIRNDQESSGIVRQIRVNTNKGF